MNNTYNPWEIIGIDIDATPEDIKLARNKLAVKNHPDKIKDNDNSSFQTINE